MILQNTNIVEINPSIMHRRQIKSPRCQNEQQGGDNISCAVIDAISHCRSLSNLQKFPTASSDPASWRYGCLHCRPCSCPHAGETRPDTQGCAIRFSTPYPGSTH